jgi:hypothetical protein
MEHLSTHYHVEAFAVCRDQIATDGFTIWGAPIAGYYPSKVNCWSPALQRENQINTPAFRMLGQDPVHYYQRNYKLPNGRTISEPDTMEPVWTSGRSPKFIETFLEMIVSTPSLGFAYVQLGQENSFPWRDMAEAYPKQMTALAELRRLGKVHVETMENSGKRFKKAFKVTPSQAQIMLDDPFGNTAPSEGTIWYQSRFYRANLHFRGDLPYFRDIAVYKDDFPQPFLHEATRQNDVEQRMPAVLDGFHWSTNPTSADEIGAGAFFTVNGERLRMSGRPVVQERGRDLEVDIPIVGNRSLRIKFEERGISFELHASSPPVITLSFEWDPAQVALKAVRDHEVLYEWQGCRYGFGLSDGTAACTGSGFTVTGIAGKFALTLAQEA